MLFEESDRRSLLGIARRSIESAVRGGFMFEPDPAGLTPQLGEFAATFVTLHEHGQLRGCIGLMRFDEPIWRNVRDAAVAAALDDPRFPPVPGADVADLEIEVSVLEPPVPIADAAGFVAGRHGIVVERGEHRALLLPQVATEMGWGREQMLDAVCRKAGLPGDAWCDPATRLAVFEAYHFCETELGGRLAVPGGGAARDTAGIIPRRVGLGERRSFRR